MIVYSLSLKSEKGALKVLFHSFAVEEKREPNHGKV